LNKLKKLYLLITQQFTTLEITFISLKSLLPLHYFVLCFIAPLLFYNSLSVGSVGLYMCGSSILKRSCRHRMFPLCAMLNVTLIVSRTFHPMRRSKFKDTGTCPKVAVLWISILHGVKWVTPLF